MPLKTLVKVGTITNLSDARYSAGMGVDMLGFNVLQGQNNFVDAKTFQEIRGWVSGPAIVAEAYGFTEQNDFALISEQYAPDYLELNAYQLTTLPESVSLPLIVCATRASLLIMKHTIDRMKDRIAFILISESDWPAKTIKAVSKEYPVLVSLATSDIKILLAKTKIKGIALNGSKELKPGLKDYDHLAQVLEQLDAD